MKKLLIIALVIIAGAMFAYPMQVLATTIVNVGVDAICVEDGTGGYDVTYEVCIDTTPWGSGGDGTHEVGVEGEITFEDGIEYDISKTFTVYTPGAGSSLLDQCRTYTEKVDKCGDYTIKVTARITDMSIEDTDDGKTNSGTFTCTCAVAGDCWLTAGGVKFEPITGDRMATGGGPKDTVGGVAYPSCSPFPSNGGQWNHVAHSLKLHLIGKDITVLRCGNVEGIDPGSESPVCDVNFIEFEGTGIVKGIHGNKIEDTPVTFFVRAEDRNEPGNEHAVNSKDGEDIDRYFLRVEDDGGNVLILVDVDGIDDFLVDPLTITGGNFQIHCTSCD